MTEPRICYHAGSRKIYNEGYCGEFKTYSLPARTIKMYGSTLNLKEGCNRCRAKLLKEIVREHKRKPSFKPCRLPMDGFIKTVRVGSHREWVETRPKHGFHRIVEEYTTKYSDCLPGKAWLKEHEHDRDKYPEPTIELSINGKLLSVNGDYKHGMIRDFMKPYITKVRVGRKVATLNIGEADRVIKQAVEADKSSDYQEINERSEKKMHQKPNNHKRRQILDFARDNNLVIHPGGGFEYYIKNFYECGHCPCAKERLECPCPESIEECKTGGHCKCHLFWRDLDTYKDSHVPEY